MISCRLLSFKYFSKDLKFILPSAHLCKKLVLFSLFSLVSFLRIILKFEFLRDFKSSRHVRATLPTPILLFLTQALMYNPFCAHHKSWYMSKLYIKRALKALIVKGFHLQRKCILTYNSSLPTP